MPSTFDRATRRVFTDDEAAAMDIPVTGQQDGFSDYGSDFSPDEEEILNGLLHQTREQDDGPNSDPGLLLHDIKHEEGPRGARVPHRQGQQDQDHSLLPSYQNELAIQLHGDNKPSANCTCRASWPC